MKTGMKQLGVLVLTTFMGLAQAQDMNQPMSFMGTGGGNGGDPIEPRATRVLMEIKEFFTEERNQEEFPEIDFQEFMAVIDEVRVFATDESLVDKYGNTRCLINEGTLIKINRPCWVTSMKEEAQHYPIMLHEVLGVLGVEVAGEYVPSEYQVSSRLSEYVNKKVSYGLMNLNVNLPEIYVQCKASGKSNFLRVFLKFNKKENVEIYAARYDYSGWRNIRHEVEEFFWNLGKSQKMKIMYGFKDVNHRGFYSKQNLYSADGEGNFFSPKDARLTFEIDSNQFFDFSLKSFFIGDLKKALIHQYSMRNKRKTVTNVYECRMGLSESFRHLEFKAENELNRNAMYGLDGRDLTEDEVENIKSYIMNL